MRTLLIVLGLFLGLQATAQPREKHGEKIKAARIEFMKKKLALTPEEEKAFIPLYTDMLNEMDSLRRNFKDDIDLKDVDLTFMTDKECEKLIESIQEFRSKELEITKRYTEEFKKVLPIKKVAMIYKAEFEFRRELVERLREERRK
ncbi:MAG TPA: hypothetical protein DIW47_12455 [Bacteroidetes bacterium]|nr:hypothetical protein [Bacteroidota bacterium]